MVQRRERLPRALSRIWPRATVEGPRGGRDTTSVTSRKDPRAAQRRMAAPSPAPAPAPAPLPAPRRPPSAGSTFPPIRRVGLGAPVRWLRAGLHDLRRAPGASLFYGAAFALMGWLIFAVFRNAYEYAYGLTAGFLLVGPFLATGLYEISRRLHSGAPARLRDTLAAWRANAGGFGLFAVVLTVIMLVWSRASLITFALFFSDGMPQLDRFLVRVLSLEHWDFVLTWFAVGGVFALIVFAVSVVSVPMMLDRGTDTIVAALTSVRALLENPAPLLVWAALIVLLIGAGFATLFVGLALTAPVVGHATWHAYRDLVGEDSAGV
jgi:uncharacterized membrane protein